MRGGREIGKKNEEMAKTVTNMQLEGPCMAWHHGMHQR
jgi:hypothetical protein